MARKDWSKSSARQRRGVVLGAIVQVGLLVNFVGPISYFLFGRRR